MLTNHRASGFVMVPDTKQLGKPYGKGSYGQTYIFVSLLQRFSCGDLLVGSSTELYPYLTSVSLD